ncbi:MAG: hypothetical protein JOZ07_00930 [Solirubrobacterales bacterium]|nr:hypothetical protein [Solirubrobacterales bacterium]
MPLEMVAAEASKVPFYVCGGLLAAWAVVLAGMGLRRPSFPGGLGGQRLVVAISAVLVAITIGTAIATA